MGTWGNFNLLVSNNVAHTNKVTMSSVANGDSLTINGVTISFKTSPTAA